MYSWNKTGYEIGTVVSINTSKTLMPLTKTSTKCSQNCLPDTCMSWSNFYFECKHYILYVVFTKVIKCFNKVILYSLKILPTILRMAQWAAHSLQKRRVLGSNLSQGNRTVDPPTTNGYIASSARRLVKGDLGVATLPHLFIKCLQLCSLIS